MLLAGCARTVTPIVAYGDQLAVEVTLRGNVDVSANRYFLVIGNYANYKVPLPPPDQLDLAPEFIEPDMTPQIGTREAYFANYFSTWAGYVVSDTTGHTLVQGPFDPGQAPTREVLGTFGAAGNKLTYTFRLGKLFAAVPDQIYFDVVAVPWPSGDEKIPADHLPSLDNHISKIVGSIIEISDLTDFSLAPSLDITHIRLEVQ